jgi:hypothetical protein
MGKKFPIFNSPEALYVWLNDSELQTAQRLDPSLGSTVFLRSGEIMEVEWLGCEFFQEDGQTFCLNHVRLAKTMKIKGLDVNKIVGVHSGWVMNKILSFSSGDDTDIKLSKLTSKSKHKFDIAELFLSRGLIEKEDDNEDKIAEFIN